MKDTPRTRKTKIVCTLGPATSSPDRIAALIAAGMDVARLNFSHGDHDSHRRTIHELRRASERAGREVGILQDLAGPKIRLGTLPEEGVELPTGGLITLAPGEECRPGALPVNYPHLIEDVAPGDPILLADGIIELEVESADANGVLCRVLTGGAVTSHKGVNLPGTALRVPSFTDKDRRDLRVGLEEGVDFVALSFVRHEQDVEEVLGLISAAEPRPMLIAKIEKPQAVERLEQILAVVDGVMIARGDLGVEMPVERVPLIQKRIIRLARLQAKPVITATQMLRSMVDSPRPLRAEATDVANAVLDGTDAVMLSEETAIGNYPVEAVQMLDRISRSAEPHMEPRSFLREAASACLPTTATALSRAAAFLALDVGAAALVASTSSGSTARLAARFRLPVPVAALTPNTATARQLTLSWGVEPVKVDAFNDTDSMFDSARAWAERSGVAPHGEPIIVTAGIPLNVPGTTNLVRVLE